MNVEKAGSIVRDLRQALQDVVAPDLKAVSKGLADLKEELRTSNAQLREDLQAGHKLLREEMAAIERRSAERLEASERRFAERLESSELRTAERIARVYDKIENVDLTRRNEQLMRENESLRSRQTEQRQ